MKAITNKEGLIGDFLGTIPAMQALAQQDRLIVEIHPNAQAIVPIISNPLNIIFTTQPSGHSINVVLSSQEAFQIAVQNNWYMTQAFLAQASLDIPTTPPKADLIYSAVASPEADFILSPFARSLPPNEKWSQAEWQRLVDMQPHLTFCLIGSSKDDPNFIKGHNVKVELGRPFNFICQLLKSSKGLISVVTGTSHLAFHLGVKNYLINNQSMLWGTNPDAVNIRTDIPKLKAEEIIDKINLDQKK